MSLNLNLETIVTSSFGSFLERVGPDKKIVVEVQAMDVFTNLSMYLDVQGALKILNHAILIDGLTVGTLRLLDVSQLKPDYAKVAYAPEMEVAGRGSAKVVQELVAAMGEGKIVLSRVESPSALSLGLKNGISLFQGRFLDSLKGRRKR